MPLQTGDVRRLPNPWPDPEYPTRPFICAGTTTNVNGQSRLEYFSDAFPFTHMEFGRDSARCFYSITYGQPTPIRISNDADASYCKIEAEPGDRDYNAFCLLEDAEAANVYPPLDQVVITAILEDAGYKMKCEG